MTRNELEHIIRASADITGQYEFIIVGSQSILGPVPNPQAVFTMSAEADIYPLQAPELAGKIDGAIGGQAKVTRFLLAAPRTAAMAMPLSKVTRRPPRSSASASK